MVQVTSQGHPVKHRLIEGPGAVILCEFEKGFKSQVAPFESAMSTSVLERCDLEFLRSGLCDLE